jgi:hypothetical protein
VVTHGSGKWHTTKGLSIGDPVTRLRALHRNAVFRPGIRGAWPSSWWLVPRGNGRVGVGGSYPGLLAETLAGRVFAFHVRYQRRVE